MALAAGAEQLDIAQIGLLAALYQPFYTTRPTPTNRSPS
jgi:hypothetical protein